MWKNCKSTEKPKWKSTSGVRNDNMLTNGAVSNTESMKHGIVKINVQNKSTLSMHSFCVTLSRTSQTNLGQKIRLQCIQFGFFIWNTQEYPMFNFTPIALLSQVFPPQLNLWIKRCDQHKCWGAYVILLYILQ